MAKEILTIESIRKDLDEICLDATPIIDNWRLWFVLLAPIVGLVVGIVLKNLWIGLLIAALSPYHTVVMSVRNDKNRKKHKKALDEAYKRGDLITVKEEVLERADVQEAYVRRGSNTTTTKVYSFRFESGAVWSPRRFKKHYEWSKDSYISTEGLEHMSLKGDVFYRVTIEGYRGAMNYYPAKLFVLDKSLIKDEANKNT